MKFYQEVAMIPNYICRKLQDDIGRRMKGKKNNCYLKWNRCYEMILIGLYVNNLMYKEWFIKRDDTA